MNTRAVIWAPAVISAFFTHPLLAEKWSCTSPGDRNSSPLVYEIDDGRIYENRRSRAPGTDIPYSIVLDYKNALVVVRPMNFPEQVGTDVIAIDRDRRVAAVGSVFTNSTTGSFERQCERTK